jgi:carboxyl-terminal processing protease
MPNRKYLEPFFYSLVLVFGLIIGKHLGNNRSNNGGGRLNEALNIIASEYVDTVNQNELSTEALQGLLQKLDPHSVFIEQQQISRYNAPLDGNFEGIGIEYNVIKDTVFVMRVFAGGPASNGGLRVADRIVKADSTSLIGLDFDAIAALIKGPGGSKVNLLTVRSGKKKPFITTIKRGKIDIPSIPVSYMLNDNAGYLKLDQFSATTTEEFIKAADQLNKEGMTALVLDLRNNTGGYLQAAIDLLDAFFGEKKLLSYTSDRKGNKKEYFSTTGGSCSKTKLVVLVNGQSASASELFSGAIQDHKRGTIVGSKTYGKGLVQESFVLSDGSAIRLTVARYYTPNGKCIQKTYEGLKTNYDKVDLGGIQPDVQVEVDSNLYQLAQDLAHEAFLEREVLVNIMNQYATRLNTLKTAETISSDVFMRQAIANEIKKRAPQLSISAQNKVNERIIAMLIRDYLGEVVYYKWKNTQDKELKLALEQLKP